MSNKEIEEYHKRTMERREWKESLKSDPAERKTSFMNTNFSGANLRNANFSSTEWMNTDFTGADLRGANFENCTFHNVIIPEPDPLFYFPPESLSPSTPEEDLCFPPYRGSPQMIPYKAEVIEEEGIVPLSEKELMKKELLFRLKTVGILSGFGILIWSFAYALGTLV